MLPLGVRLTKKTEDEHKRQLQETDYKLSDINSTIMQMYLIPYDNWVEEDLNFNKTNINFTFEAVEFYEDTLVLQIKWNSPIYVSSQIR